MINTAPMSLLHLRSSAGLYGADKVVLSLNRALVRQGIRSRLLTINNYRMSSQPLHEAALTYGDSATLLPCNGRLDWRTVKAIADEIRSNNATILHVHDYKSAIYGWLASRLRPVSLVATQHGWIENSRSLRLYTQLELLLLKRFDALAVVSAQQVERLLRSGVRSERIHQVDNGIDIRVAEPDYRERFREEFSLPADAFVFGTVGRLSPEKNLAMLLDTFALVSRLRPHAYLCIVGDGELREPLQAQAEASGLRERVIFTGPRSDMPRIYAGIDCLVLPSLSEGMPLVVLEAMAAAIPVIASAVGDVPRLLLNTDHGRLVPAGDAEALRIELLGAAAHPHRRDVRAREQVLRHHSTAAMADRYLDVYESLLRGQHGLEAA